MPDARRVPAEVASSTQKHGVTKGKQSSVSDEQIKSASEHCEAQRLHHKKWVYSKDRHKRKCDRHSCKRSQLTFRCAFFVLVTGHRND